MPPGGHLAVTLQVGPHVTRKAHAEWARGDAACSGEAAAGPKRGGPAGIIRAMWGTSINPLRLPVRLYARTTSTKPELSTTAAPVQLVPVLV
jgi:hypothetical protein